MNGQNVKGCPPWLKKLNSPTDRLTGLCHIEKYHSLIPGTLAHMSANIVKKINTTLELTCFFILLQKL